DVHELAVGRRRGAGEAVELVPKLQRRVNDLALPKDLAVASIQTQQHAFLVFEQTGSDEDAITMHDRRGMSVARNGRTPGDILHGLDAGPLVLPDAPGDRQVLLERTAIQARPTPARPILRAQGAGADQQGKNSESSRHRRQLLLVGDWMSALAG